MTTQETVELVMKIWKKFWVEYSQRLPNGNYTVLGNQLALWPDYLRRNLVK